MPSLWTQLYLLMTTSLSVMLTRANPELDDVYITFSSTDITLGSPFAMEVIAEPLAFMMVAINVVYPNGTATPVLAAGSNLDLVAGLSLGIIPAEIVTSQFNPTQPTYCTRQLGFSGSYGYTPSVAGTYTVMPYVQYYFATNGYRYENNTVCIDAPITVETVPISNLTLNVNPSGDGQTTLTSVPTSIDASAIIPSSRSLASFVAEPTGDEYDLGLNATVSGPGSGSQPPSPTESTGRSGNTRKAGLPLTLLLCVIALGTVVL